MELQVGQPFPYALEEAGTIMDYVDGHFILVIKDAFWNDAELAMAQRGSVELDFVYRYDVAVFLLTMGDIDTSDFYFNIQENEEKERLLAQSAPLSFAIVLLDEANRVCLRRDITLSKTDSACILEALRKQQSVAFREGEYDVNAQGLMSAFEPFEMQAFAVVKAVVK